MAKETNSIGRARHRLMGLHLPNTISEYPFEVSITAWGLFAGAAALIPGLPTPSVTLQSLPVLVEHFWGLGMLLASITMAMALRPPLVRLALLARGIALAGIALLAFGVAIFAFAGWPRMLTGVLLVLVGFAALIRGSKLRADYYTALEELTIEHRNGNGHGGVQEPKEG